MTNGKYQILEECVQRYQVVECRCQGPFDNKRMLTKL